ncbi:MAG: hypothetical protein M3N51_03845 [Actinomycetota bacterium]|nr:hypothetical protein [Actinomycetota bacterium]
MPIEHRVTATYSTANRAREVIAALERHGVEATHISFQGPAAEESATKEETRTADARVTGHLAKRIILGGVVGAVLGLVGALILAGDSLTVIVTVVVATSSVGGMIGGVSGLGMSGAWADTFQSPEPVPGSVEVHSEDPELVERAASILQQHQPLDLRRSGG